MRVRKKPKRSSEIKKRVVYNFSVVLIENGETVFSCKSFVEIPDRFCNENKYRITYTKEISA